MLHAGSNNESMGGWAYLHLWGCKYQWQESRWTERSKLYCGDWRIPTSRVARPTVKTLYLQKPRGVTCSDSQNLAGSHPICHSWISLLFYFFVFFLLFSYLVVYAFSLMEVWFSWLSSNLLQCYSKPTAKKATKRKTLNNLMLVYVWLIRLCTHLSFFRELHQKPRQCLLSLPFSWLPLIWVQESQIRLQQ